MKSFFYQVILNLLILIFEVRPVATNSRPVATNPRPVATNPRPVATNPRPVATNPRPVATNPRTVVSNPRPHVANSPAGPSMPRGGNLYKSHPQGGSKRYSNRVALSWEIPVSDRERRGNAQTENACQEKCNSNASCTGYSYYKKGSYNNKVCKLHKYKESDLDMKTSSRDVDIVTKIHKERNEKYIIGGLEQDPTQAYMQGFLRVAPVSFLFTASPFLSIVILVGVVVVVSGVATAAATDSH